MVIFRTLPWTVLYTTLPPWCRDTLLCSFTCLVLTTIHMHFRFTDSDFHSCLCYPWLWTHWSYKSQKYLLLYHMAVEWVIWIMWSFECCKKCRRKSRRKFPRCNSTKVMPFRILSIKFQAVCRVANACGMYVADLVQYRIFGKEGVIVFEGIYMSKAVDTCIISVCQIFVMLWSPTLSKYIYMFVFKNRWSNYNELKGKFVPMLN